ncbi:hypothetical protein [Streptomyces hydrogenans]
MALQRARVRRIVLTAEDLAAAEEGPGTQLFLDPERETRLRIQPVLDRLNARWGHPVVRPTAALTPGRYILSDPDGRTVEVHST